MAKNKPQPKVSQDKAPKIGPALPDEVIAKGHMAVFSYLSVAEFGHGHPSKKTK